MTWLASESSWILLLPLQSRGRATNGAIQGVQHRQTFLPWDTCSRISKWISVPYSLGALQIIVSNCAPYWASLHTGPSVIPSYCRSVIGVGVPMLPCFCLSYTFPCGSSLVRCAEAVSQPSVLLQGELLYLFVQIQCVHGRR